MSLPTVLGDLSDPTEIPPPSRDKCSNTPVAWVFSKVSQTIAATPPLLSVYVAHRSPKAELGGRVSQKKLAPKAYRAIGGIA